MKEKITKIYNLLVRIPARTYVSIIMLIIAVTNMILTSVGKPVINLGETEVTYIINNTINVLIIIYTAYKNNSVSEYAILADKVLFYLRDGKITKEELEDFINTFKNKE